jgi:hypothetical protein
MILTSLSVLSSLDILNKLGKGSVCGKERVSTKWKYHKDPKNK